MGEIVKEYKKEITIRTHEFHCYKCNKHIFTSEEFDDGWYEEPKTLHAQIFLPCIQEWYHYVSGYLCDECYKDECKELEKKIKDIGFEKGMM